MTTDELIRALRKTAEKFMRRNDELPFLLNQAADRLENRKSASASWRLKWTKRGGTNRKTYRITK